MYRWRKCAAPAVRRLPFRHRSPRRACCSGSGARCRPRPLPRPLPPLPHAAGAETINAPMPGNIVNVHGQGRRHASTKGQVLLVLEAMKMENEIMAPRDGVVAGVHVNKGDSVDSGKLLISLQ